MIKSGGTITYMPELLFYSYLDFFVSTGEGEYLRTVPTNTEVFLRSS